MNRLVGKPYCTSIPLHKISERFAPSHLMGKLLNSSSEISESALKELYMLKNLTGNDEIHGEFKGQDAFFFKSRAKMLFACNNLPSMDVSDATGAFFERMLIVPFGNPVDIAARDHSLLERLWKERAYIIHFAMKGLKRLFGNNFVFTQCKESEKLKQDYIAEEDTIGAFFNEWIRFDPNGKITAKELAAAYARYCEINCVKRRKDSDLRSYIKSRLSSKVECKKIRIREKTANGFVGISFVQS